MIQGKEPYMGSENPLEKYNEGGVMEEEAPVQEREHRREAIANKLLRADPLTGTLEEDVERIASGNGTPEEEPEEEDFAAVEEMIKNIEEKRKRREEEEAGGRKQL